MIAFGSAVRMMTGKDEEMLVKMDVVRVDTVAVQMTGAGVGAIGVVLVTGPRAGEVVRKVAHSARVAELETGACALARIGAGATEDAIDEALVVRVGEERFEVHVHGGLAVMEGVLGALGAAGARVVGVEEAAGMGIFGPGIEGEILADLARAKTPTAARRMLSQPAAWREWAAFWDHALHAGTELWRFQAAVQWVLERSRTFIRLLEPARVALIGAPNVGKSTLANALLGRHVSITSEHAGTTRDWVDAETVFTAGSGDWRTEVAVVLVDTAGVRETEDVLETESISRTHVQAAGAEVVVLMFDATRAVTAEELARIRQFSGHMVVVVNKMDAGGVVGMPAELRSLEALAISAKNGAGLELLMEEVLARLDLLEVNAVEPFAFNGRILGVLGQLAVAGDVRTCREGIADLRALNAAAPTAG